MLTRGESGESAASVSPTAVADKYDASFSFILMPGSRPYHRLPLAWIVVILFLGDERCIASSSHCDLSSNYGVE